MSLEPNLSSFRVAVRANCNTIIKYIKVNVVQQTKEYKAVKPILCFFCSANHNLTKEHIIPRWVFNKDPNAQFEVTLNGHKQTYNKSTIPACANCNSVLLNSLERYMQSLFAGFSNKSKLLMRDDIAYIIRWLEIIDYKFQIMNLSKKFLSPKNDEHIPYLADFPLYMLLQNKDLSPSKVVSEIRKTLIRMSVKTKDSKINSLVVFKTNNKNNHFFHNLNEFIFLEIGNFGIALFYFYQKSFDTIDDARDEAMSIITQLY